MPEEEVPTIRHDDGMFQFRKKLEHAALSMEQLAGEVIVVFRKRDRERVLAVKKPVTRNDNLTEKETIRLMHEQAGRRPITAASLFCFSTRREHENARNMNSFLMHMEPDYVTLAVAARDHERYCWRVSKQAESMWWWSTRWTASHARWLISHGSWNSSMSTRCPLSR